MITLYHNDMSVCAAKVRIALAEKKLAWEGVHLNLRAGDAQKPDYLKLNPNAVVPTLVHDGRVITESTVICEYIDDRWPGTPLKPSDSFGRARMRLWTKQLDEGVHGAVGTLSFCIAFRHQWLARSAEDRARWLAGIPQSDRRRHLQSILELGLEAPSFAPAVRRYVKLFDDIENELRDNDWLAGAEFSLADIGYAPYLARLSHLGFDKLFDSHPGVAAWAQRVAMRSSVLEGLARWFNPAYLEVFAEKRPEAQAAIARLAEARDVDPGPTGVPGSF
jgi:glutathione S-transferase